ncbi:MAG: hypothetical protein H0X37_26675, partial [Herpetosiphonaceae bacterium]|nr:hypothetical protein [Herpetosiphonaceae bacterium]
FGILTGLADRSPTPIDNTLLETFGPMLLTWLDKELDKRQGIAIVPIPPVPSNLFADDVQKPLQTAVDSPAGKL